MIPEGVITPQSIFNTVARHLLTQGERSLRPMNGIRTWIKCAYRGVEGRKCAVGCLIPDELYNPVIEGEHVRSSITQGILEQCGLKLHVDLLSELQVVHDGYLPDDWRLQLSNVAEVHLLDASVLKEFA